MKYVFVFSLLCFTHSFFPTASLATTLQRTTSSNSSLVSKKKMSLKEKISQKFNQLKNVVIQEDTKAYTEEEKLKLGKESLRYGLICWALFLGIGIFIRIGLGPVVLAIPFINLFLSIVAIRKGNRAGKTNKNGKTGEILGFFGMLVSIAAIIIVLLFGSTLV